MLRPTRRAVARWVPLTVLAVAALGCSDSTDSASGGDASSTPACAESLAAPASGTVGVTEHDFAITLASSSGSAGSTTFSINNEGPSVHEFVVFATDLPADQLPLDKEGTAVDEEGAGITPVDEVEDIAACSTESLTVDLQPGNYVAICNITSHYGLGMRAAFTVS